MCGEYHFSEELMKIVPDSQSVVPDSFISLDRNNNRITITNMDSDFSIADMDDENFCKLCLENQIDCTLIPCNHNELCFVCAKYLKYCPFCRDEVENINVKQ